MRSHGLEHSFPEWKPCIGLIRLPAVLGLCLRSALDAFLSVMTTPIVRAKWRHELEIYKTRRRARAQSRIDGGPGKEIGGRLKVVHDEDADTALLKFPGDVLSDHKLDDASG